jgi:hypothetical protein
MLFKRLSALSSLNEKDLYDRIGDLLSIKSSKIVKNLFKEKLLKLEGWFAPFFEWI